MTLMDFQEVPSTRTYLWLPKSMPVEEPAPFPEMTTAPFDVIVIGAGAEPSFWIERAELYWPPYMVTVSPGFMVDQSISLSLVQAVVRLLPSCLVPVAA